MTKIDRSNVSDMKYFQSIGMKLDKMYFLGELSHTAMQTYDDYRREHENDFNYAELSIYYLENGWEDLEQIIY
jgi:hypothetical protein